MRFNKEGGENMAEFVLSLIALLGIIVLAYMYYNTKNHTVDQICNHPELSDEKVKMIAEITKGQFKVEKLD